MTADVTATDVPAAPSRIRPGTAVAAGAVAVTGVLHLVAAYQHLSHDIRFAVFFLAVGAAQILLAPRLLRGPRAAVTIATIAATVVLVLLYLYSRTIGVAIGPHADRPEDPEVIGISVVVLELVVIAGLLTMLPPRARRLTGNALAAVGAGVWMLWLTGALS